MSAPRPWRLIPLGPPPPEGEMERDHGLFKGFSPGDPPLLRFFQFPRLTFTLGRLDARRLDLSRLAHPYEVRPTGGWSVLHGAGDLCYSIVAPTKDPLVGGDLLSSYRKISLLLQKAFRSLGREVELSSAPHRSKGVAHCFCAPSKCELTLKGRKVSGGAQAREADVFLQQGVILLSVAPEWRQAFGPGQEGMTGLNEEGGDPLDAPRLQEAVIASFEEAGVSFNAMALGGRP